jgi:glutamine synthetase
VERRGLLTVDELRAEVVRGDVDTVLIGFTDMQGRLQGKRLHARYFLDEVLTHGSEACNYLLAIDVDMSTVDGYELASWERGYGDFVLVPDLGTLRRLPWHDGTALVLADVAWENGEAVRPSPRQVLERQLERLAERGWTAMVGTELEFIVLANSYEDAWSQGYRDLEPANQYNADYSILATSRIEPLLRGIRNSMTEAAMVVESAKGECNLGQHEITFRYDEAMVTCDNHVVYKNGAKEIAAQQQMAITFMAKLNQLEGSSCHIHLSLRDEAGAPIMAEDRTGMSALMEHFLAGQLAAMRELCLFLAPNINSYKRFQPETFAPTAVRWGRDNRTCSLRVVGHGESLRMEHRVPGADVNPYLAVAALVAAGLHGIEHSLPLEPACTSNAYAEPGARVPTTLRDALDLWKCSSIARGAFGDDVVDHYANMARVELAAFDAAVTDWERYRGFERL